MSALPGSREPGVSRTNGTPGGGGVREQVPERVDADVPVADGLVAVLERPRTSIESLALPSRRSRPGRAADLDDRSSGRGRAAGSVERRPAANVAGVQADVHASGVTGRAASRYGARSSTPAHASGPDRRSASRSTVTPRGDRRAARHQHRRSRPLRAPAPCRRADRGRRRPGGTAGDADHRAARGLARSDSDRGLRVRPTSAARSGSGRRVWTG